MRSPLEDAIITDALPICLHLVV